jgi:hypothetical protein
MAKDERRERKPFEPRDHDIGMADAASQHADGCFACARRVQRVFRYMNCASGCVNSGSLCNHVFR